MSIADLSWTELGRCGSVEPDLFFPVGPADSRAVKAAKRVCATCPVQRPCLAYALETGQRHGVWGGTDEEERRALRSRRRSAA